MGKLLSLLARDNSSDCCGPKSSYDIFLDFENAQPNSENASEIEVYEQVNEVLVQSDKILEEIQVYKVTQSLFPSPACETSLDSRQLTLDKRLNDNRCKDDDDEVIKRN